MTWKYDITALSTSAKDQVRLLIGDVIQTDQQLQDEEIALALFLRKNNVYYASAECCQMISSRMARKWDTSTQSSRQSLSQLTKNYASLKREFEAKGALSGSGTPYMGGISVTDKSNVETDTDRVPPNFNYGMMDNHLPVGPVGNEMQSDGDLTGLGGGS